MVSLTADCVGLEVCAHDRPKMVHAGRGIQNLVAGEDEGFPEDVGAVERNGHFADALCNLHARAGCYLCDDLLDEPPELFQSHVGVQNL